MVRPAILKPSKDETPEQAEERVAFFPARDRKPPVKTAAKVQSERAAALAAQRHRTAKKKRQEAVLNLMREGNSVRMACAKTGIVEHTYDHWMLKDEDFKAEVARIRERQLDDWKSPVIPFGAEFRQRYLGFETPFHLAEGIDFVNSLGDEEYGIVLWPPAHAKSTLMEDYSCYCLATNPNIRIIWVSKSQRQARKRLGRIQDRMTNRAKFADFIDDFGPFKGESRDQVWTQDYCNVWRKDSGERDYSIEVLGLQGQIYGNRAELVVLDDIADLANQTDTEIQKQIEWLTTEVISRLEDGGVLICIGTRMRENDVYHQLMDAAEEIVDLDSGFFDGAAGFFDKVLIRPAILREPGADSADDPGEVLWPERKPMAKLQRRRSKMNDERRWQLNYQQVGIPSEGMTFPMEVLEDCFDPAYRTQYVPPGTKVAVGVDPAATGFTAGVVLAVDPLTKLRYVVDVWNEKNLTGDGGDRQAGLIQFIVELCETYGARKFCTETNNMQTLLTSSLDLRNKLANLGVDIHHHFSTGHGPQAEDIAIEQLSGLFFNKMIVLPEKGRGRYTAFLRQFAAWRPGVAKRQKRDIVKAFQFAEKAARSFVNAASEPVKTETKLPPYLQAQRRTVEIA